jgi:hypothetical protein
MRYTYEDYAGGDEVSSPLYFSALKDDKNIESDSCYEHLLNDPLFHTPSEVGNPEDKDCAYPETYDGLGDPDDKYHDPDEMGTYQESAKKDGFVPPSAVRKAAALGLELRKKFNRGGTEVGVARARDLKNGKALSKETIGRMVNYFSRHTVDKKHKDWGNRSNPSPGWVAWLLWGGDPGERWCNSVWKKINPKASLDTQGEEEENVPRRHTVNKGLPDGSDGTSRPIQDPAPDPHFFQQPEYSSPCCPQCTCDDDCECGCVGCYAENSEDSSKGYEDKLMNNEYMSEQSDSQASEVITHALITHLYGSPILAYYDLHDVERGAWASDSPFLRTAAKWTREYINNLPDSSFAYIEPAYRNGETADKNARHLPHHDASVSSSESPTPNGARDTKSIDTAHLNNALARVNQVRPVTDSVSAKEMETQARAHLTAHANKLRTGDHDKETAMASTTPPKGKSVPKSEGPLDPYTFPKTAPASEGDKFHPPGSVKVPGKTSNETYKENDDAVFTKDHHHKDFSPESGLPGIKPENSPTYKEIDDSTFPGHAGPGSGQKFHPQARASMEEGHAPDGDPGCPPPEKGDDMNRKVEPGPQSPETERHQQHLHQEQESDMEMSSRGAAVRQGPGKKAKSFPPAKKKAAPKPPWDKKKGKKAQKASAGTGLEKLPGMDYMKTAGEEHEPSEDGHVEKVEKCALEADLYARRFAKHANIKDLHEQASRFTNCRAGMEEAEECADHDEEEKAYLKDVFAYSYGQMQRSIKRAMRNFAEEAEEPNMEAYHDLVSMKADLLGERSSRHFAAATFSYQMATWMAGDESMADSSEEAVEEGEGCGPGAMADEYAEECADEEMADEFADEEMAKPNRTQDEGEEDMKEADVAEAINIASQLQDSGLVSGLDAFRSTVISLAKMTQRDRQNWVAMASNIVGAPITSAPAPVKTPMGTTYNRAANAAAAESNHVRVASRHTVGGKDQPVQANRMIGLFMGGTKAPLFNGMSQE